MKILLAIGAITFGFAATAQTDMIATQNTEINITPISHATMVWEVDDLTIFFDPVGGAQKFSEFAQPDLVFITDIHGDHLNLETLEALDLSEATMVVPEAVADKLQSIKPKALQVLSNGDAFEYEGMSIRAIPMYNLPESTDAFHTKGRGNGYVIEVDGERIYVSGDTEDIPEMRQLENIDIAFVCMNLPWTMDVEQAASAVLDFNPKKVYPFHYRGGEGKLSDVAKFKALVNAGNSNIEVVQLEWYPKN